MRKFTVMALVAVLSCGALTACNNTLHGAGEDIENAGEKIQSTSPRK